MKKVLFLIHDLGQGGAEKVLVNLVNNMDKNKFDITVMSLFSGGVNEQFLSKEIKYIARYKHMIRGNSKLMKLFSPVFLHKHLIKEKYDIEISYLEGPCARIISGCKNPKTKLVSWIHVEQHTIENLSKSFRNIYEAQRCYSKFDNVVCVSNFVKDDFVSILNYKKRCEVLYNTVESDKIQYLGKQPINVEFEKNSFNIVAVGSLKKSKGYHRLLSIMRKLTINGFNAKLYILGKGPLREELEKYIEKNGLSNVVYLLGYDLNPYRYVAKADLFVCASYTEGFSTAATESLIVGTPVCTVNVSGMKEMLGENNEYGLVTDNDENSLYDGISSLIIDRNLWNYYKKQAIIRGKLFDKENTVKSVEEMLINL